MDYYPYQASTCLILLHHHNELSPTCLLNNITLEYSMMSLQVEEANWSSVMSDLMISVWMVKDIGLITQNDLNQGSRYQKRQLPHVYNIVGQQTQNWKILLLWRRNISWETSERNITSQLPEWFGSSVRWQQASLRPPVLNRASFWSWWPLDLLKEWWPLLLSIDHILVISNYIRGLFPSANM